MRSRTKTVITLETWRRTTVRIARKADSVDEPALDRHEAWRDVYRIAAPADTKVGSQDGIGGQEKVE